MEQKQKDIYYIVHICFLNRICDLVSEYTINTNLPTDEIILQLENKLQICHLVKPEYLGELIKKSTNENVEKINIVSNIGFSAAEKYSKADTDIFNTFRESLSSFFNNYDIKKFYNAYKEYNVDFLQILQTFNIDVQVENNKTISYYLNENTEQEFHDINREKASIALYNEYQNLAKKLNSMIDRKLKEFCEQINQNIKNNIYETITLQNIDASKSEHINLIASSPYTIDHTKNYILATQEESQTIILCDWDRLNDERTIKTLTMQNDLVGFTTFTRNIYGDLQNIFSHQLIRRTKHGVGIFCNSLSENKNTIDEITNNLLQKSNPDAKNFNQYCETRGVLQNTEIKGLTWVDQPHNTQTIKNIESQKHSLLKDNQIIKKYVTEFHTPSNLLKTDTKINNSEIAR